VTLQDVARRADVPLATASRVLNGTARVRPDLRERVLAAATALAYAPNAHAQALARASSQAIGLICHDVSDPYFATIARGVTRAAAEHGLLVMLAGTFRDVCSPPSPTGSPASMPAWPRPVCASPTTR
jgi:LacI family transcriptional regulator